MIKSLTQAAFEMRNIFISYTMNIVRKNIFCIEYSEKKYILHSIGLELSKWKIVLPLGRFELLIYIKTYDET